jgi:Na+/proline symporter
MPAILMTAIYFICCLLVAILGRKKTMGFWGYFFGSIVLSPVIGFLLMIVSAKRE